jgi:mannitol-1-phosphate 5-dehydrogenase
MKTLVQFGAGNIGRSFVGQLFSRAGYEVVFVDVDETLVRELNARREYVVEIRDDIPAEILVRNIRAVDGRDRGRVAAEVATASILATAVGKNALPAIVPLIARGLELRAARPDAPPLDLIIAENILDGAAFLREALVQALPAGFSLAEQLGLVETSIGKMVPIIPLKERARDPLRVYAEAYNTLILDRRGFRGPLPDVPGLDLKDNMKAYVARKSFIHNLGHALSAYLACIEGRPYIYTWEAMRDPELRGRVKAAMMESGRALLEAFPGEFTLESQEVHVEDLLKRFANARLGDTLFRVGRDIARKLGPDDRLIGAMRCDLENGVEPLVTAEGAAAACFYRGVDEDGRPFDPDERFRAEILPRGLDYILERVCGLKDDSPVDRRIRELIRPHFDRFALAHSL